MSGGWQRIAWVLRKKYKVNQEITLRESQNILEYSGLEYVIVTQ